MFFNLSPWPRDKTLKVPPPCQPHLSHSSAASQPNIQELETQLAMERFLSQLDRKLHAILLGHVAHRCSTDASSSSVKSELLLTVVAELQVILQAEIVAIALPQTCGDSDATQNGAIGQIRYIAAADTNQSSRHLPIVLHHGRKLSLMVGESLTGADLEALKHPKPYQPSLPVEPASLPIACAWELAAPDQIMGWLIVVLPRAHSSAQGYCQDRLQTELIPAVVDRCTYALHQARQLDVTCAHCEKLEQQNQELMRANRLKNEFLANTSHEIRTPLSSILGFTQLIQEQGYQPGNARHHEYLNIIRSSGQHLLALINDILDLSKIEANQLELQWETVNIPELCRNVMALVKEKAYAKQLALKLEIDHQVTTLVADPLRLKQMLFNLLSNALKFTSLGGVGLNVTQTSTCVSFMVWDTGIGLTAEQQRQLFRPYCQVHNPTINAHEGTGLGLALTQKLVELHHGGIEVKSSLGKGSQFIITLPLQTQASSAIGHSCTAPCQASTLEPDTHPPISHSPTNHQATQVPSMPSLDVVPIIEPQRAIERLQILLVEDHPLNAALLRAYLDRLSCNVTWVKDGQEMWQVLDAYPPDLILMDIGLPTVDGLTLIRQLRQSEEYQGIPIIAQTAMAMTGDREVCLEAGADDYISKPIHFETLKQLIVRYTYQAMR